MLGDANAKALVLLLKETRFLNSESFFDAIKWSSETGVYV